jgi:hypothetical protein
LNRGSQIRPVRTDRKERLPAPAENERMGEEVDGLLATSQRLLAEMQALVERAKQLLHSVKGIKSDK